MTPLRQSFCTLLPMFLTPLLIPDFWSLRSQCRAQQRQESPSTPKASSAASKTQPWERVLQFSEADLDTYFVLHGTDKLAPPRDFEREHPKPPELDFFDSESLSTASPEFFNLMGQIGGPMDIPLREEPGEDLPALKLLLDHIKNHNETAQEYHKKMLPEKEALQRLIDVFATYPIAKDIEQALAYEGYDGRVASNLTRVVTFIQRAFDTGQTLHLRRVRIFKEEVFTGLRQQDQHFAWLKAAMSRGLRAVGTFFHFPYEYTTDIPLEIARRMHHAYAVPCDELQWLTGSRWNWPQQAAEVASQDFDYWYQWATDSTWYAGTKLVLDATAFPKSAPQTRALFEEYQEIFEEEPYLFLSPELATMLRAPQPPKKR